MSSGQWKLNNCCMHHNVQLQQKHRSSRLQQVKTLALETHSLRKDVRTIKVNNCCVHSEKDNKSLGHRDPNRWRQRKTRKTASRGKGVRTTGSCTLKDVRKMLPRPQQMKTLEGWNNCTMWRCKDDKSGSWQDLGRWRFVVTVMSLLPCTFSGEKKIWGGRGT